MKIKRIITFILIILCLCLTIGIGDFIYNSVNAYKINKDFTSVPLQYNPYESSSVIQTKDVKIKAEGSFVKGIQKKEDGTESFVIRALSPLPAVTVMSYTSSPVTLTIENVNPDFYAKSISENNLSMTRVSSNTLEVSVHQGAGETVVIQPVRPSDGNSTGNDKYIILGDNRDGYDTFAQIIQQVNGENPSFVIDNGDLVYSGKSNQYRLFDKLASKISTTLCVTPGNHDIRGNGLATYTMLYGPTYYSFDFEGSHFIFLDSSPGWVERQAISNAQYIWLEEDLKNAQGKRIFVITHIPPVDPRTGVSVNEIPNYVNQAQNSTSWLEKKLDEYSQSKSMNHGFQDPQEAAKFEDLMSTYHVDTVYLSHIHSYLEYTKDGVRYLISGGAGAELLTQNSYYHYMIAKIDDGNASTIVEMPSPANSYLMRYGATIQLFATALYEENPVSVVLILAGITLLLFLLIIRFYLWKKATIDKIGKWFTGIFIYAVKSFKDFFGKRNDE